MVSTPPTAGTPTSACAPSSDPSLMRDRQSVASVEVWLYGLVGLLIILVYLPPEDTVTVTASTGSHKSIETKFRHLIDLYIMPVMNKARMERNGVNIIASSCRVFTMTFPLSAIAVIMRRGAKARVCNMSDTRFIFSSA